MTRIVGLTGGIGSGKTMVANYMKSMGIPVYIADSEAKKIIETAEIIQAIKNIFGNEVIENQVINREKLAQIVFNNPKKLQELNRLIHPLVEEHFYKWVQKCKNYSFVVKEAAILFESGNYKYCDEIITITAPLETRIERVLKRDHTNLENILIRMQHQWSDDQRIAKSTYVIHNISVKDTKKQVDEILNLLKKK